MKTERGLRKMIDANLVEYANSIDVPATIEDDKESIISCILDRQNQMMQDSEPSVTVEFVADGAAEMNEYALRVWNGQSVSLPLNDRVYRVVAALKDQGLDNQLDKLTLPIEGFERYLK